MLLELTHETVFQYSEPVSEIFVEFRLTPLTDGSQHLLQHRQRVSPPRTVRQYVDAWGNTVSYFNLTAPQEQITVAFDSVIETFPRSYRGQGLTSGGVESPTARTLLYDFLRPTPLTQACEEFYDFIRPLERLRSAPVAEAVQVLSETLHGSFRYEGEVTTVSSPIGDILRHRAGVCQDFAHLMIASCRHLGYPARYVSGYVSLENGEEELASHAWCEVFDPDCGWLGVDPTHNRQAGEQYVCLGVGRDYRDVPPNRGLFRGEAEEKMTVRVSVQPVNKDDLMARARALYPQTRPRGGGRGGQKPALVSLTQQAMHEQQQQQQ